MRETEMEDLLWDYPELFLNEPLKQFRRQPSSAVGRADLIFTDRIGRLLIVEIKHGKLTREAISQLHDYFGMVKREFPDRVVELMVIANQIPEERRLACAKYDIDTREISEKKFRDIAAEVGYALQSETSSQTRPIRISAGSKTQERKTKGTEVTLTPFRLGTRTSMVFQLLKDEKPHTKDEVWDHLGRPRLDRWPHVLDRVIEKGRTTKRWTTQKQGEQVTLTMSETFDFILVGAGSAGSVIAARLSEDPACPVALLEMGERPPELELMPVACAAMQLNPATDWMYTADPGKAGLGLNGRRVPVPRGKMLGGSSGLNYMAYVRGHPGDFDSWAEGGAAGWSYAEVLPYFRKSEGLAPSDEILIDAEAHNSAGPMGVSVRSPVLPGVRDLVAAAEAAGIPRCDYNGRDRGGAAGVVSLLQTSMRQGKRSSTYRVFLEGEAERRPISLTVYHLTSTCRIGSVVDPRLQVVGIGKLRVADASVMPNVVSGNTNAASIMIGEKAAEMVADDHGVNIAEFVGERSATAP